MAKKYGIALAIETSSGKWYPAFMDDNKVGGSLAWLEKNTWLGVSINQDNVKERFWINTNQIVSVRLCDDEESLLEYVEQKNKEKA